MKTKNQFCTFPDCTKSYTCASKLRDHMNVHSCIKPYGCNMCHKTYCSKKALDVHIKTHDGYQYSCKECSTTFLHKHTYKKHRCSKQYTCIKCNKKYEREKMLRKHESVCGTNLSWNSSESEEESSVAVVTTKIPCEICECLFKTAKTLKEHQKAIHEGVTQKCQYCGKEYRHSSGLSKHLGSCRDKHVVNE
ncbi:ZN879 [Enterospora canceri]|uniref:ZN879 n=1 Tax=Enterospora canceri TaxID=1081671 RepID=A0A1Y1S7P5_9MICR|nr:ZN879 [Enterospora canceri]